MQAVCLRYLGQYEQAISTLGILQNKFPLFSRAFQEEGHLQIARIDPDSALKAYQHATRLNPALLASWKGQLALLLQQGNHSAANQIRPQLERLGQLPGPLLAVMDLASQGKLIRAEDLCRQFLQKAPKHIEGMRLLADIGVKLGVLDDAEFLLESAVMFAPEHSQARIDYIEVLRRRQKFETALAEATKLLTTNPVNPQFQSLYAIVCMQTGDYEKALEFFDRILEVVPTDPGTLTSKGHALKTIGKSNEAIESYRQAMAHHPEHGEAYFSLANLKTYSFSAAELEMMHGQEDQSLNTPLDRIYIKFALGKAYEDCKDYDQAFQFYEAGNELKKAESRYDADQITEEFELQKQVCVPSLFAAHAESGHKAQDPIFILGLPRSGSTLLEQILSSHSLVDGTLELPNILSLAHRLRRGLPNIDVSGYPEIMPHLNAGQLEEFGQAFIENTRIHRQGAPFFIDKMPNNFRHIGLIKLILPNAKIIDARREPMACCFSGFKQLFAEGQEFTYSLENIGQYYRDYVQLMNHWDKVLPGYVLRVQHEDVVSDLEGQVRRLLEFCGLPFETACVEYHKTERNVRTPSSEQVRQPIFTDALEQWRNFESHLQPLKDALGDSLTNQEC
ncbi:MAG: tetratricopeptide (TPR) repeat protein [Candidatus Azotimanducaceae bacterium]|jgi:tetratricopeptide (TPR) repeat protein